MNIIFISISIFFFSLSVFFIYRSYKLVKDVEELQQDRQDDIQEIAGILELMLREMREIDIRGSFESDDEVGSVFKLLKETIEKYRDSIND